MRFGVRELVFVLLLVALPVASYYLVFKPRNEQIARAHEEILAKQAKLRQLEAATAAIKDLGKEIDRLVERIRVFEQKLPAERETEVVLKQVWELASKQTLVPRSVRTDKAVLNAQYSELPIKMVITGNFDGFYSFLLDMEKLSRITRAPKMKLTKDKAEDGLMKAEVVLSIFFEPQGPSRPAAAPATAQPATRGGKA